MKVLSFLPLLLRRSCLPTAWLSSTLLRATALELVILAGHVLIYPSGLTPERRASTPPPLPSPPGNGAGGEEDGDEFTRSADTTALPTAAGERPPVVLLHGFIDNRSVFVLLRRSLARHGWHHLESLNYSPLTCDIRTAAELLDRHVEEICARTGHREIDIVGHSLGGLIARYYVQRLGGDRRVRTLVTLGTPHGGTAAAPLAGAHPIVRQMRGGSDLIEELRLPAPGCRTRFISFWSELDRVMLPVETACVDHPDLDAVNVRVTGIGHLALPVHPAVASAIRQALESDGAAVDAPGAASVA
ncbi:MULTISPECIES: triacylglycerol lipase [unclassified Streptomyces]|uniref:esterase/lipase family protein n=1 Tax=unclassified Streptomyces TaxID=2593676 RepID=UPI000CD4D7B5|nr:alpha/beta fold hydrolase [Streptomyces sp. SM10]